MSDWILFGFLLAVFLGILIRWRRQEDKHLKKRVYDAMSPELRKEIDEERRANMQKQQKFQEALKKAGGGKYLD